MSSPACPCRFDGSLTRRIILLVAAVVMLVACGKQAKEEAIPSEGLSAQFDASKSSQLFPNRTVEVTGSKAALVAALEKLAVSGKEDGKEEAKVEETAAMTTSEPSTMMPSTTG